MVRGGAGWTGQRLSCNMRQYVCESAHDYDAVDLPVSLHSTQTKDAAMYSGRGLSGGNAAFDRMGSSIGQVELRGMAPLRHALPVAIPSFHAARLGVSPRLRSCGLFRVAPWQGEISFCAPANDIAAPRFVSG